MEKKTSWSYTGDTGPEKWSELAPEFHLCSCGKSQSPIDISEFQPTDHPAVVFRYTSSKIEAMNTGHTIQVNLVDCHNSIIIDDVSYKLVQFHFHAPSEHTIRKTEFAMELHLVHADDAGNLVVVGVMINPGAENTILAPLWDDIIAANHLEQPLHVAKLMPNDSGIFRYSGSLTTPPCTEDVTWLIFETPIELSESQIQAFTSVFPPNNRPLQPLNGRQVVHFKNRQE